MLENTAISFWVWGIDHIAYGPVELPTLVHWVRDGRVLPETWVFHEARGEWKQAAHLTELKVLFKSQPAGEGRAGLDAPGISAASLRRIKILADVEEKQMLSFLQYLEVLKLPPNATLFRKGDYADAMFFVLEGEVRARLVVAGKESTLATLGPGECFGELALLDQGPRSADILSNQETVLLKITAASLKRLFDEAPALAAPFLLALSRTITARMRSLTKHYEDSIRFTRTASGG